MKQYRLVNKEKVRAGERKWRKNHPEKVRLTQAKWDVKNHESIMLSTAKCRAKKRGIPFTITEQDIQIPKVCPVLGMELQAKQTSRTAPNSPSLDRIRPELGYIPGNVRVISWRANMLKNNATLEEIEAVAKYVRESYGIHTTL